MDREGLVRQVAAVMIGAGATANHGALLAAAQRIIEIVERERA
jgi:hypothetical protein